MMKTSFSTLACPDWNLTEILQAAVTYGYDGVELRVVSRELDLWNLPEFQTSALAATPDEIFAVYARGDYEQAARLGKSLYLLGGGDGIAAEAARKLVALYPALRIVGTACPEPGSLRGTGLEEVIAGVRAANPDLLMVALGQAGVRADAAAAWRRRLAATPGAGLPHGQPG